MFESSTQIRVRYAETDQMGYVYYGNYAMYYEVARVETMRQLGCAYKDLEAMGIMMPVLDSKSRFVLPGKYDEELEIKVRIPKMPMVRILFEYEIRNEVGELIHTGETTLAFIKISSGKPTRMPEMMKNLLSPFFDE